MAQQNVSLHGQRMIPGSISWRTLRKKLISEILRIQRQVNGLWLPCLLWMQILPFSLYNRIPTSNTLNYLSEPNSGLAKFGINIFPTLLVWFYEQQKKKKNKNSSVFTIRKFWLCLNQVSPPSVSLLSSSMKLEETFQRGKKGLGV